MRIAVAEFSHETCTFCPDPTTVERFERGGVQRGPAVLERSRGIPCYVNGFMRVLEAEKDVEIIPLIDAPMPPGPYTSWLTPDCFEKYTGEIVEGVKAAKTEPRGVDGVLLALHGAMAVREFPKPEAEIVRRVRAVVGPDVPIMVTLDLHANEDHELTDAADGVFVLKTYPHVDSQETGEVAARCMLDTVRGNFRPVQAIRKPGIICASIYQGSEQHPMKDVYDRCREWETKEKDVYCVSVAPGYAYSDVPDVGITVIAVTNGKWELANRVAQDVSDFIWSMKESYSRPLPKPQEGVAHVLDLVAKGVRPVIIADHSDRTGDSTHILKELLAQGARNFGVCAIADAKVVQELERTAKVGDTVAVAVGGYASEFSGKPVEVAGKIEFLGDGSYVLTGPMNRGRRTGGGLVVSLDLGNNNHLLLADKMRSSLDAGGFTSVGIDVGSLDIVVLKDRIHHRAYWDSVAKADVPIDAPGLGPADLSTLPYENIPKDIYPLGPQWRKS